MWPNGSRYTWEGTVALNEIWMPSPHYSTSRGPYNKAVLHTTEGATTIENLGSWFANPSAGCSSHHGADNHKRGVFGAYVYENYKAWTQGNANDYCVSIELCTPSGAAAGWSRDYWLNSQGTLVHNAADWVAYVCGKYGIPIKALSVSEAQNSGVRGVCQHMNLGSWGSGHSDCGSGFPMDQVIEWAKSGAAIAPVPEAGDMTPAVTFWNGALYQAMRWSDGRVCYAGPDTNGGFHAVDENSNAKSGVDIAISDEGKTVITYVNQGNEVCHYIRFPGESNWSWVNIGGSA